MSSTLTTASGDEVAYDVRGDGPVVVFVAGAGPFRAIDPWTTRTAELLAEREVRTVVHDRLGRGESPAEGELGLEREIDSLRALIEVAGGSAVLCGHSSGCTIALYAACAGLPVDGLVLFEAPLGEPGDEVTAWITEVERLIDDGDLEGALGHYMKDMPPEWLDGARQTPAYPAMVDGVRSYRADGRSLVWASTTPYDELLRGLDVPLLSLVGESTFPGMSEAADALATAAPRGRSATVAGADHCWDPEAMAEVLAEMVTATSSASGR